MRSVLVALVAALVVVAPAGAHSNVVRWFHSPSRNIECEVASGDARGTYAYCQTFKPLQTVQLKANGRSVVCAHRVCPVGNGPINALTLAYGHSLRIGIFRCTSAVSGVRCVVSTSGHGFTIARAGIKTFQDRHTVTARRRPAGQLAWCAVAGAALYVSLDVALVFLRPQFSVLHSAESDYGSRGAYAWVMDANFVLRCLLSLAVVQALRLTTRGDRRMRVGRIFLVVWALASGALAFFPDDPVGTQTYGLARVHVALAFVAFIAVVLGTRIATRALMRDQRWRRITPALAVLSWGALVPILLLGHAHLRPHSLGGLYEKAFLGVELAWFVLVAGWIALGRADL